MKVLSILVLSILSYLKLNDILYTFILNIHILSLVLTAL